MISKIPSVSRCSFNAPVDETIEILKNVHKRMDIPLPDIAKTIMQQLLRICTTKTLFRSLRNEIYQQCNGASKEHLRIEQLSSKHRDKNFAEVQFS